MRGVNKKRPEMFYTPVLRTLPLLSVYITISPSSDDLDSPFRLAHALDESFGMLLFQVFYAEKTMLSWLIQIIIMIFPVSKIVYIDMLE